MERVKEAKKGKGRTSVSAEVYGKLGPPKYVEKVWKKTEEEKE